VAIGHHHCAVPQVGSVLIEGSCDPQRSALGLVSPNTQLLVTETVMTRPAASGLKAVHIMGAYVDARSVQNVRLRTPDVDRRCALENKHGNPLS